MNATWMGSPWWSYILISVSASVLSCGAWCFGSLILARDGYKKDVPKFVAELFFQWRKPKDISIAAAEWQARLFQGVSALFIAVYLLGFESHLWVNVQNETVTLSKALEVQPLMFGSFLAINLLVIKGFEFYLSKRSTFDFSKV